MTTAILDNVINTIWVLNRWIRGVQEMPVVHNTYLIRADVLCHLTYNDETPRHNYVVFSESARKAGVPQYLDNRQIYGYIKLNEEPDNSIDIARALLHRDLDLDCLNSSPAANEAA